MIRSADSTGVLVVSLAALLLMAGCASAPPVVPVPMGAEELRRFSDAEAQLASPDAAIREKAGVALLSMARSEGADAVLMRLRSAPEPEVRASMVRAVEFTEDRRCFRALLDAVKDPDDEVKRAAARALGRFSRPNEVQAVVDLIREPILMPGEVALLLRTLGDGMFIQATPVLLAALDSPNADVRDAAGDALKNISGNRSGARREVWELWWDANRTTTREAVMERREGPEYDFNGPLLETVLRQLAADDPARPVVLSMLFLSPGRHAGPGGDIEQICASVRAEYPELDIAISPLVAEHPGLVDILAERLREASKT